MSSVLVVGLALAGLLLGYVFYSRLVARWIGLDYEQKTPAVEMHDGVDYVAARHWTILFGHHFASIAGAAPIIGPVIACLYWGWLPALLWIVIGGVFFGAVHDFAALTLSVRNRGVSIAAFSESVLGKGARVVFSIFVALALILVVAVFAAVAGKTLADSPEVVLPTFGLIGVAFIIGFLVYRTKLPLILSTLIGTVLLAALLVGGKFVRIELAVDDPARWWTAALLLYAMVAAVLPVTVLLQPRDHLSAILLFFGMLFGFVGLCISQPAIRSPALVSFSTAKGWMWPMLLVVIACGALSGFHSLVASGTTSKQLARARDARVIGYGAMILESALAVLAVAAVTAGLYWKSAPTGAEGLVYQDLMREGGWIRTFGVGYGEVTRPIFGGLGYMVGVILLNAFVMTTLDSATRITRYIFGELLGDAFHLRVFRNRYATTLLVGVLAGALALGNWQAIWPVFGSSNQLIAAMVLIIVSVYLMRRGRRHAFTAIPAIIMLITTIAALAYNAHDFVAGGKYFLATIAIVLILLAFFVAWTAISAVRQTRRRVEEEKAPSLAPAGPASDGAGRPETDPMP